MHQGSDGKNGMRRVRNEKVSKKFRLFISSLENNIVKLEQEKTSNKKMKRIKQKKPMADETFAMAGSSIHVQPEELRRQAKGIKRKTPRWQPRGDDTQSFRPLVQEERGVLRVRLLA